MSVLRTIRARSALAGIAAMALIYLLSPVVVAAPAQAADFVMKVGTATINETQHQFIKFYKEEVEKASGGRIEVQIYPASQLGPIPREIEGVQLGNIQGYVGPVTARSNRRINLLGAFDVGIRADGDNEFGV